MTSVIIPCHNEEKNIGKVLDRLKRTGKKYDVVVVDDGSIDMTKEIAISYGHKPVSHERNKGKSSACISGVKRSTKEKCVFIDGDGQLSVDDIPKVEKALNDADIVIGQRHYCEIPFARKISNKYAAKCVNYIAGTNFGDVLCGFRAVRKNAFNDLEFKKNGYFFESEMIIRASEKRLRIKPVNVSVDYSIGSRMPFHKSMHIAAWLTYLVIKKAVGGRRV